MGKRRKKTEREKQEEEEDKRTIFQNISNRKFIDTDEKIIWQNVNGILAA